MFSGGGSKGIPALGDQLYGQLHQHIPNGCFQVCQYNSTSGIPLFPVVNNLAVFIYILIQFTNSTMSVAALNILLH
jgi:hypothetical protein